jgi:hypothetical protein
MKCPHCNEELVTIHREESHVETHGFTDGLYERWTESWEECAACRHTLEAADFPRCEHCGEDTPVEELRMASDGERLMAVCATCKAEAFPETAPVGARCA